MYNSLANDIPQGTFRGEKVDIHPEVTTLTKEKDKAQAANLRNQIIGELNRKTDKAIQDYESDIGTKFMDTIGYRVKQQQTMVNH